MKKNALLCAMLLSLVLFIPVFAQDTGTEEPVAEDTVSKAQNIPELVYQGVYTAFDKLVDISEKGRRVYGINFNDDDNLIIGQEWPVKELDIIKDNKLVMDLALGYVITEVDVDGTETTNDDVDTAMLTGSINLTFKDELDAKLAQFSNTGIGLWAGVDPNAEFGYGIQMHTQVDELFGLSTENIFIQVGLIALGYLATD